MPAACCGCASGEAAPQQKQHESRSLKGDAMDKQDIRTVRYSIQPSTSMNYLLLQIENEEDHKVLDIVIDQGYWRLRSGLPFETNDTEKYVQYMLEHDSAPFVLPADKFAKFAKFKAKPITDEQRAMTPEQIEAAYLEPLKDGGFTSKKGNDMETMALVHLLLTKGYIIQTNCLNGSLIISR